MEMDQSLGIVELRSPMWIYAPGLELQPRVIETATSLVDLMPTVAHLAKHPLPDDRVLDGKNLWPLLAGETDKGPHDHFHYFAGSKPGGPARYRGVRDRQWKLVVNTGKDGVTKAAELYDLGNDPGEKFNRLKDHPGIADRLLSEAQQFRADFKNQRRPVGQAGQAGE